MSVTVTLSPEIVKTIGLVGSTVTYADQQWQVHSIEGHDWYAFNEDGTTTADFGLEPCPWIGEPVAYLVPAGHSVGEGYVKEVPVGNVRRGVCLAKTYW